MHFFNEINARLWYSFCMLIDAKYLPILQEADSGCPKCQFIIATYFFRGKKVPKDLQIAKRYYKLLANHNPEDVTFIDTCYSQLLLHIGYLDIADKQMEEASKYLKLAESYIRDNYTEDEAETKIKKADIHKYLAMIEL